jgi:hypothetical protein
MPTRRIFISHSTKGDAGLKLLTAVAKRLDDMKYGLLLDRKNLVPGGDWYQNVSEWMMACSGAILLLNADADKSPYVQYEASVLSHRWRTDDGAFKLFVALVDPTPDPARRLTRSKLSQGDLGATRISQVHVWSPPENVLNDPETLADALVAATQFGPPTFGLGLWDRMTEDIVKCLSGIERDDLETAATAADTRELLPLFGKLNSDSLVRTIAAWLLETTVADPQRVRAFVTQLRYDLGTRRQLFLQSLRAAESHWLPSAVAECPIARSLAQAGSGATVAVNGKWIHIYTLECFIRRVLGPLEECPIIKCDEKSHSEEAVVRAIQTHCAPDDPDLVDDEDIAAQLGNGHTVCLLQKYPRVGNDDGLLTSLSRRFPYIVFVAWPGLSLPSGLAGTFQPVDPAVDLEMERARRASWSNLKAVISPGTPSAAGAGQ